MLCSLFYDIEDGLLGVLSAKDNNLRMLFLVDLLSRGS